MNNYRKISFDIDFAGKKVLNTIQIALEELTQNDFNSSLLELKLMQGEELINLQGLSVVLNFLMPSGKDYVDTINAEMIDIENSIVSYFIPKDILSEVGTVVGTVSLYKEGYRYTSIVQFKFEVVSDFVEDREIVESDNYPILAQMIGEVQNFKDEEMKRIESEIERIENEEKRESSELQREIDEVERHEAENVRIINEQNREVKELERDQAERLREANSTKVKREEEVRIEAETLRVQSELSRVEAENNRIQSELTRQSKETDRQSKESERQEAENLRVSAETMREAKQNEFNARAEEVALRIEEQAQRIDDLVEIEESKLVKSTDMIDYMGKQHSSLRDKSISDVEYAVKTAVGEFNYLDYEGQHITATNSIGGHVKSAILKGNTLNYLLPYKAFECRTPQGYSQVDDNVIHTEYNDYTNYSLTIRQKQGKVVSFYGSYNLATNLQKGKTYTLYIPKIAQQQAQNTRILMRDMNHAYNYTPAKQNEEFFVFTVLEDFNYIGMYQMFDFTNPTYDTTVQCNVSRHAIIVEGDFFNQPLPLLKQGLNSVRMPVLTTTGKNLASPTLLELDSSGGNLTSTVISTNVKNQLASLMKIEPNKQIVISKKNKGKRFRCFFFDQEPIPNVTQSIGGMYSDPTNVLTVTSPSNAKYLFVVWCNDKTTEYPEDFQVEYGTVATSHQPHKTNILTCNEEVTLRGIGEVKDELNLLNGKLTQRIGEIVLDGSQTAYLMTSTANHTKFIFDCNAKELAQSLSDKLNRTFDVGGDVEGYFCGTQFYRETNDLLISIATSKIGTPTVEGLNRYLSQNPITVQYQLATESVKTVVLSDNVVYSYDEVTHYDGSSEDGSLIPTVAVSVPTDLQAVISQQRNTIQTLIFENEVLKEEVSSANHLRETGDLELLSSDFELDFRLMEIESALDIPTATIFKGVKSTSRSPYEMAKVLISAEKYDYHDMHYKLGRYLECKKITEEQYNELISLID